MSQNTDSKHPIKGISQGWIIETLSRHVTFCNKQTFLQRETHSEVQKALENFMNCLF